MPRVFEGIRRESQINDAILVTKPPVITDMELQAEARQGWLNFIQNSEPPAALEDLYAVLKIGERKENKIGLHRELSCINCSANILQELKTTSCCTICQEFTCGDCKPAHFILHISQNLQRGLAKRAEDDKIREKQKAEHDRIVELADASDPLGQFYQSRNRGKIFEQTKPWRPNIAERADSSDEENLTEVEWCSGCGSFKCQLTLTECRRAEKTEQLTAALDVVFDALLRFNGTIVSAVLEQHEQNQKRVRGRDELKSEVRERIRDRHSDNAWSRLDEVARTGNHFSGLGTRRILQSLLFEGVGPKNRMKHVEAAAKDGFEYMAGGAAASLQRTAAMTSLKLGISALRSVTAVKFKEASSYAKEILN